MMKYLLILPIKFYKRFISPLFPARCRFYPSCSTYALTAVQRFGFVKGGILAAWRLLRCNPFNIGGVDYVPEEFHIFKSRK